MNKKIVSVSMIICLFSINYLPIAMANTYSKYIHFRDITIDGNKNDWSGINPNSFAPKYRRQSATEIEIANEEFTPDDFIIPKGDVVIWKNNDIDSIDSYHKISLTPNAPYTWDSSVINYSDSVWFIPERTGDYEYQTTKETTAGSNYTEGHFTVKNSLNKRTSYSVYFANNPNFLYIGIYITNISDSTGSNTYLKGIDIIMDDFAIGEIQGDNAVRINQSEDGEYKLYDCIFDNGYLIPKKGDSNMEMEYLHSDENEERNYNGDFFAEIKIPIDSTDLYEIGASMGQSIGIQVILRMSDSEQDQMGSLDGVNSYYLGGGYPISFTRDPENEKRIMVDPNDFFVVSLSGDTLADKLYAIIEEFFILGISASVVVASLVFGGIVLKIRSKKKTEYNKSEINEYN